MLLRDALRSRSQELRDHEPHKPFVTILQLRELPAEALDLAPLAQRQFFPVKA